MADSYFSDFGLLWYLEELKREEFWKFKELLKQEPLKFMLKPIPWAEIKKATKEELAKLLEKHYPGKQAWEVTLSLFLQINRKDLWLKAKEEMRSELSPYRNHMKTKFHLIWEEETCLQVPEHFYRETVFNEYISLYVAYKVGPLTVVLSGPKGSGKTTLLRKLMLEWANGNLWRDRFAFVFFFSVYELNGVAETSLAELVSRDWPASEEVLEDVFAQPVKILFIMDGFEELKFDLEQQTDLCSDWRQRKPTQVILSSLLQKAMLPECSLLLGYGKTSIGKYCSFLENPTYLRLKGFSEQQRKLYFSYFFGEKKDALRALSFVRAIPSLFALCENPLISWLLCTCMKWQQERGEQLHVVFENTTSLHAFFLTGAFRVGRENCPPLQNRAQMKSLCTLAAEGIWTQTYVFSQADLRRHGVSESDVVMWLDVRFLRPRGDGFVFNHTPLQEFCAALFYFLGQPGDQLNPVIGSIAQLVAATMGQLQSRLYRMGIFLFGICSGRITGMLGKWFGMLLSEDIKPKISQCLQRLSKGEPGEVVNFQNLSSALFEIQEREFVAQVMDFFEEIFIYIDSLENLAMSSFCLKNSRNVKKLHLCVDDDFPGDLGAIPDHSKKLAYWRDLCSVFSTSKKFELLDMDNCKLDDASLTILWKALAHPTCKIQALAFNFMSNFGNGVDFSTKMLLHPHLKYLNLYRTNVSSIGVRYLCEMLKKPKCNLEVLKLGKCDIKEDHCDDIASVLVCNSKLKCLSLVENPLNNTGVMILCKGLKRPECVLESLILNCCCLTSVSCDYFSKALLCNRALSLLDLGSNMLEDTGVATLCEVLKHQNCTLKELWLVGCYLTADCCKDIVATLICNESLKTLKLGSNEIQDAGVRQLCEALRHPNFRLQRLGLEMCQLTTACVEDLASALITCKSLKGLNLDGIMLDHDGVVKLCEALTHVDCVLELLGLDKTAYGKESWRLLSAAEERKPDLTIQHEPWAAEENKMKGVAL
ncbi:NACHT, LRR and PYD domains-containing protein 9 [Oryctolagus cuniculus]|uniref:NACHT, LRR and PYD domains-containing protein 9 n=1 Tax=Oryctolagus cuniculus TaxID=9986 RepID=UPI00387A3E1F